MMGLKYQLIFIAVHLNSITGVNTNMKQFNSVLGHREPPTNAQWCEKVMSIALLPCSPYHWVTGSALDRDVVILGDIPPCRK